ncbi:MAG TPA: hypothetical protein HA289_05885, partial [Ferroplasma sp.]|nr:hypothetical protein [Ferroplasma sp.]
SMKAAISSETNAHKEDIPPVFQQWHAAKAIEGNLGDHVRSSNTKVAIFRRHLSMCKVFP